MDGRMELLEAAKVFKHIIQSKQKMARICKKTFAIGIYANRIRRLEKNATSAKRWNDFASEKSFFCRRFDSLSEFDRNIICRMNHCRL